MLRVRERALWAVAAGALAVTAYTLGAAREGAPSPPVSAPVTAAPLPGSIRVTMAELHRSGGLPSGWSFNPAGNAAAGRQAFEDYGCYTCHAVEGAGLPQKPDEGPTAGPDLTGMGAHHPAEYFVESILNPDAILVEGPSYIGADGHSAMPSYPDMTARDLRDIVAFLMSLKGAEAQPHVHVAGSGTQLMPDRIIVDPGELPYVPPPPPRRAKTFLARSYSMRDGMLPAYRQWFARDGARALLASPGLLSVDTFVNGTCHEAPMVTVFGFADQAALDRFLGDPQQVEIANRMAEFISPRNDRFRDWPPFYRVDDLSVRAP